ncbi:hypothetical protein HBH98_191250 [Parastagonospora nodorum]|nr:hypothetical protein HBH49_213160 [Parastagonospora nodorum]KAH4095390.1 hypothetical protein HBH46_168460 [Parastagonospora nodorum]KAH4183997.1 hypothetical protein HBH42_196360 [Parastagonospora nodorum]KAH4340429.1 hypothetical protein HBH98_191250 [Parastagonospora nodorum]KAH4364651.1 hypothetical protein HBH97_177320 [Parastagonospora nodorum]
MSVRKCKSTCVGLLRNLGSSDAEPLREEVLRCLHGKTDILDAMFIKNSFIYVCKTQMTTVPEVKSRGLSLHINPGTNYVKRWRPGSILLYFISHENILNGLATLECIREGMVQATNEWHRADINITFQETHSDEKATFTVIYDTAPSSHDFAEAFFPGDGERIVRLGPLAFEPAHIKYIANILRREEPAWYFPSKDLNHSSIMNHRNAVDLSLLVVGDRDRDEASRFYKLAAGKYGDVEVVDVDP